MYVLRKQKKQILCSLPTSNKPDIANNSIPSDPNYVNRAKINKIRAFASIHELDKAEFVQQQVIKPPKIPQRMEHST